MRPVNSIAEITSKLFREHFEKLGRQTQERAGVNILLDEMRKKDKETGWIHAFNQWKKLNDKQRMKYLPKSEVN